MPRRNCNNGAQTYNTILSFIFRKVRSIYCRTIKRADMCAVERHFLPRRIKASINRETFLYIVIVPADGRLLTTLNYFEALDISYLLPLYKLTAVALLELRQTIFDHADEVFQYTFRI